MAAKQALASWMDKEPAKKRGRPTNAAIAAGVHERALREFDRIQSAYRDSRLQCLKDRRFYSIAGAQWEGPLQDQYANKPKFEANLIQLAITKIFNEYRNNRISVDFISKDGTDREKLADTCNDLYRADEQDSVAEEAHDNAFDEGCGGGFGAWRLRAEYEDEENPDEERQRIRIEPIFDADSSVFFDLNAKRQDKADAKRCFVLYSMSTQSYIDEWGDDPSTWPKEIHQYEFDWATPDVVYVCEYYEVEIKTETVWTYENLDGTTEEYTKADFDDDLTLRETLDAIGSKQIKEQKRKYRKVHKYLLSGSKILEDCGYIAGKCIPIIPYYGKRWFVDNIERCSGVTRTTKDMQMLLNMQLSKVGEVSAYSGLEVPIFSPEQVAGLDTEWSNHNITPLPFLRARPLMDAQGQIVSTGPMAYTKAPAIPQATAALLEITTQLIRELLGNQQGGEQIVSNISGKAVEMIQNKLDMQAYIYMSNMAKAVKREGEVWLSMAKDIMTVEGRKMKTLNAQGKVGSVTLVNPVMEAGAIAYENDLSEADFDVVPTIGPTSQSRKAATVRGLTGLLAMTDNPEDRQVLTGMALMNMEGEGLSDVNEYYRKKMVRMGVVKPTDEEKMELEQAAANQQPSPEQQYFLAEAKKADANASESNARTIKTLTAAGLDEAKTAETLAGIDRDDTQQTIDAVQTLANATVETARAAQDQKAAQ